MADRIQFYQPGRSPQYGRERWERYERLRVSGFSKGEARELSRVRSDDPVMRAMVNYRQRQVRQASEQGLSKYQFYSRLRSWYSKSGFTDRNGRPSPFEWARRTAGRLRTRKPSTFDPGRPHRGYRGQGKGRVSEQKARAKVKAKAITAQRPKRTLPLSVLEREIAETPGAIARTRDPKIREQLRQRRTAFRKRLREAQRQGKQFG